MHESKRAVVAALLLVGSCANLPAPPAASTKIGSSIPTVIERPGGESSGWWFRAGATAAHARGAGAARARNVILFVGDGMSLPTVAAARILEGQQRGQPGEENQLSFETFPATALSKTYDTDSQTPDSAGTMTAMMTGVKTRMGELSVGAEAKRGDCAAGLSNPLATALELAEAAGLSTGIVTTTRLTHATPGATFAHVSERNWEKDGDMPASAQAAGCRDIARQFVEFDVGDGIEVAMGGGRSAFLGADDIDPEYGQVRGQRRDGRNLVGEWQARYPRGNYLWNAAQLKALDLDRAERVLALFEPDHMSYEYGRQKDRAGEPSLAEMTRAAITVLRKNPKGYFLMVEGGRIDHAHHAGNAYRALTDTIAFSDAVRAAVQASPGDDTLIVVTADHSHTLSFVGYPRRGNPILGKVMGSPSEDNETGLARDALGLPYTTLGYANGPGYAGAGQQQPEGAKKFPNILSSVQPARGRPDLRDINTEDPDYLQEAAMPIGSETHGGDDVGVWASGPGASAVRGSIEQNTIFHLMVQSQPRIVALLCRLGSCENGVPVKLPARSSLHRVR